MTRLVCGMTEVESRQPPAVIDTDPLHVAGILGRERSVRSITGAVVESHAQRQSTARKTGSATTVITPRITDTRSVAIMARQRSSRETVKTEGSICQIDGCQSIVRHRTGIIGREKATEKVDPLSITVIPGPFEMTGAATQRLTIVAAVIMITSIEEAMAVVNRRRTIIVVTATNHRTRTRSTRIARTMSVPNATRGAIHGLTVLARNTHNPDHKVPRFKHQTLPKSHLRSPNRRCSWIKTMRNG
ncbi:hypothetical protein BC832DRAFT_439628 [Gaertneriomyces semiglobifer]|nr:hypothetical protein BC832DRAFT_439628 [Gaertneriomyces semiglobifer]